MITIMLLSYNNPAHLKRALEFYKKVNFRGRILIADSSKNELKEEIRDIVSCLEERLFAPLLLEYKESITLPEKIALAAEKVATSYVLPAGVDDFFFVQAIYEAIWFLKHNKEYVFAFGRMYGFTSCKKGPLFYYTGYFDKLSSFEQDDSIKRMEAFLPRYSACFYAVYRTVTLQKISQLSALYVKDLVFFDNLWMLISLSEGKAKYLEKPFHWRELSDQSDGAALNEKWLQCDAVALNRLAMKECLKFIFIEREKFSEAQAFFKSNYLVDNFFSQRFKLTFPVENSLQAGIKRYIPKNLVTKILFLKYAIKNRFIDAGQADLKKKHGPYSDEWKVMEALIRTSGIYSSRAGLQFVKQVRI